MADSTEPDSPLEAAAGAAGPHTTEAFERLGNETCLAVLPALWEAYTPKSEDSAVPFSELRERVGLRDSGQFTYHLDKLTDQFVENTAEGFYLPNAGFRIVQAIIAGRGMEDTPVPPTDLGTICTRCGEGQIEISYHNEAVFLTCPECEGFTVDEDYPRGTIARFELDLAGLNGRQPSELFAASVIRGSNNHRMMNQGVCPECSGTIDASLQLCEKHTPTLARYAPTVGRVTVPGSATSAPFVSTGTVARSNYR